MTNLESTLLMYLRDKYPLGGFRVGHVAPGERNPEDYSIEWDNVEFFTPDDLRRLADLCKAARRI
jgi:hypothetical protein